MPPPLLLLALALLAGACSTNRPPAEPAVPADFAVMFGSGGGFAGRWQGYTVDADRQVWRWDGPAAGAGAHVLGRLGPDDRRRLWTAILDAGLFDSTRRETGNVTAFVRVEADGRAHRVSWVPDPTAPPDTLDQLLRLLEQAVTPDA